jgi:predicted MFS family arabinose efflux permease
MIWSSAALASATSGLVLSLLGYSALCMIGALLLVIPATILLRYRRSLLHSRPGPVQ